MADHSTQTLIFSVSSRRPDINRDINRAPMDNNYAVASQAAILCYAPALGYNVVLTNKFQSRNLSKHIFHGHIYETLGVPPITNIICLIRSIHLASTHHF